MKKLLFATVLSFLGLMGNAQEKITPEQARSIAATTMANFTESVSFAYIKGVTLDGFRKKLCGPATPNTVGEGMINTAYSYLVKGIRKDQIIKTNDGKAVASAMAFFVEQHKKGISSDGSEIFGAKDILEKATAREAGGCRWYQFWCHVQVFANWVIDNWETIQQIIIFIMNL